MMAVQLCAECVEINAHVREVLLPMLRCWEGDNQPVKTQEKLLEFLLISSEWYVCMCVCVRERERE